MDPLRERPPQQLSAAELLSRIARLEDAARVCRAELERRTGLTTLPDEIQQVIFSQLRNALDPHSAVAFSSVNVGLRGAMQRVGEGAGKSLLQQLKEANAAAAALCLKVAPRVGWGCAQLRVARRLECDSKDLSEPDLSTLGKLTAVLPALRQLRITERSILASPDGRPLLEGLGVGALPAMTTFYLVNVRVDGAGAPVLAAALQRGTLPRLTALTLFGAGLGDAGLVALAPALRRRPALEVLSLSYNPFGDEGLAALVAPPPPDAPGVRRAEALAKVRSLGLDGTRITSAGCDHLASRLWSGGLPALTILDLRDIPADRTATLACLDARIRRGGATA